MTSPKIEPVSTETQARGQELPKTIRRDTKGALLFRQVLEESPVREPSHWTKSAGQTKPKEPAKKDETTIDPGITQGLVPAFLIGGRGQNTELTIPDLSASATPDVRSSVFQTGQPRTIKEFPDKSSRWMLPVATVATCLPIEGGVQSAPVHAAKTSASNARPMGYESVAAKLDRHAAGTGRHLTQFDVFNSEDARQVVKGASRELYSYKNKPEDKFMSGATSRNRVESAMNLTPSRVKIVESTSIISNAAAEPGNDMDGSKKSAFGQGEFGPDAETTEVAIPNAVSSNSILALPPAKQISEFISKSISVTISGTGSSTEPESPGGEKTFFLELHPESIGRVRLSMQLNGDELSILIEAKSKEAAEAIEHDRSLLGRLLSEAGFRISSQDIRIETQAAVTQDPHPGVGNNTGATAHGSGESGRNDAEKHEPSKRQAFYGENKNIEASAPAHSASLRRSGVYL